jgi:hypothetical protein
LKEKTKILTAFLRAFSHKEKQRDFHAKRAR